MTEVEQSEEPAATGLEGTPSDQPARPRRLQARGERRKAQLLEAASSVFSDVGYAAASTNAIARQADVSPGTLYQFFPNKEAIALELGERLLEEMRRTHSEALNPANAELPLAQMLDVVVDPLVEFNCKKPAFLVLLHAELSASLTQRHEALHDSMLNDTKQLIAAISPGLTEAEYALTAEMSFALFKAGLDLAMTHQGPQREAYVTELKAALYRYLAPLTDR